MTLSWARPELLWLVLLAPLLIALPPLLLRRRVRFRLDRTVLRAAIAALLIVAIAGPLVLRVGAESTTIFLVDRSGSVQGGSRDAAQIWMERAINAAGPNDAVMISDFGSDVERRAGPSDATTIDSQPPVDDEGLDPGSTNIESALAHVGALPIGGVRVVLMSDGGETAGTAQGEVETLQAAGIPVDVIHLAGIPTDDLRITGFSGPSVTWAGRDESVSVYVEGPGGVTAPIELLVDGEPVAVQPVALAGGGASTSFDLPALDPGFHVLQARIVTDSLSGSDAVLENDTWPLGIVVREAPLIGIVTPEGGDSGRLQQALEAEGFRTEVVPSPALPDTGDGLMAWDAIVLNNMPAWDIDPAGQEALIDYARGGGGVLVMGGTASFGPGAYAATPLESMLPVTVKVTDGRDRPRVAVLLVIDQSGSMAYGESTSGAPKIELAREGVITAASALVSGDQVGVIAFNDEPAWALPMTTLSGEAPETLIAGSISELHAEGGTELFPAMQVSVDALRNVDADVRHIIILSDGRSRGAERESYFRLLDDATASGITVSTMGLGYDADVDLLQDLASEGGGRYHYVEDADAIPRITFEEARAAGSQSVLRGEFTPVQLVPSPIMAEIDAATMPALDGYNFAGARPGAQAVLASDRRDPLLVKWQFGLGRVVAWTGDSGVDFAAGWDTWEGYDAFWGNVISWVLPDPANLQYAIGVEPVEGGVRLHVGLAGSAAPVRVPVTVTVRDGNGETVVDPTRPEGSRGVVAPENESMVWEVELDDGERTEHHAISLPPGQEWQPAPGGETLLRSIADQTDGRTLTLEDEPSAVFASATVGEGREEGAGVWWIPAALALVLFLVDIALRLGVTLRRG